MPTVTPRRDDLLGELGELGRLVNEVVGQIESGPLEPEIARVLQARARELNGLIRGTKRPPSQRASQRVLHDVTGLLRSRELQPGDRLPPERELAEQLGVGRNSVREAIRQLAMLGLVEARQGGGTYVLAPAVASLMRPFRDVVELSDASPWEIVEFRMVLEPFIAALAARRIAARPEAIGELRVALALFEETAESGSDLAVDYDTLFHHRLAEAAGNVVIVAVQEALLELLTGFRRSALSEDSYDADQDVTHGHREILDAVAGGRPADAAAAMTAHLRAVAARIVHAPEAD
ncbi:MAG TPA: FadR/GntR family transcriptional regulator [Candidatus Dormibacteraeota bacterium]|nr:FadR/GntR family transcriptional regulator [Candidatus Dormibacteraeota bacterium]